MPRSIQIGISIIVAIGTVLGFWWQASLENSISQFIVLAVGATMLLGMWVFPEAKGGRKKSR